MAVQEFRTLRILAGDTNMTGGLIIDKPKGMTSHDVVNRVRRIARIKRVGHAGTLDPFATGLLLICLGPATRLTQFLVGLDKEYIAVVRLGFATDTQDLTGKQITPLCTSKRLTEEQVLRTLNSFVGPQLQTPPMYSAKKVGGERLYRAARAGREVERQPVSVTIYSIHAIESGGLRLQQNEDGTADMSIRVRCSSGTYVRTIAHDLGERLGVGGHLTELRRTAVGRFSIERAISLDLLDSAESVKRVLIPPTELVGHLPKIELDEEQLGLIRNGTALSIRAASNGSIRLCDGEGTLIGIGEVDSVRELIKPRIVLEAGS
jgi:tRNA pseudouridine55 synthase